MSKEVSKDTEKKEVKERKTRTRKVVKTEEVKEVKVNEVKFNEEKQSRLKFFSKFVYILAKIGMVLAIIGGVALLIAAICAPVIAKNVKAEDNNLTVFGEKVHYVHEGNDIILKYNEIEMGKLTGEEANEFDEAVSEFSEVNTPKIFAVVEFYLVVAMAMCVLLYKILSNVNKLFINIYNEDTPFKKGNVDLLRKITHLVIILAVGPYLCGLIGQILLRSRMINFNLDLSDLFFVLVLFTVTYIFEYGYEIQKDTNAKIYGDVK